jgi:hypothetical protein
LRILNLNSQAPLRAQQPGAAGAALGTQAGAASGFAWLFVILAPSHLFLDAASLDQFSEAADCLLDRLAIPNVQLDHGPSFSRKMKLPITTRNAVIQPSERARTG